MIPLLFAAAVALSSPATDASSPSPILKDLPTAPAQKLLDPPAKPPILRGPAQTSPQGSVRTWVLPVGAMPPPGSLPMLDLGKLAYAGKLCQRNTVQTAGPGDGALKKLGDLPPGLLEHAVNRIVNDCPVREIVSGGQTYYLDVPAPAMERIDPVSRVTKER